MKGARLLVALLPIAFAGCDGRLPLPGPDIVPLSVHEQCPSTAGAVTAYFLGTTSILFRDSATSLLSDGFVTRPPHLRVLLGGMSSDTTLVRQVIERLDVASLDAVFTVHTHYDHALDAAEFARQTGAELIGSRSTEMTAIRRAPQVRWTEVGHRDTIRRGAFTLTFLESEHGPGDRAPGVITRPIRERSHARRYRTGETWSVFLEHSGRTLLLHGSAGFLPDSLRGRHADVVYLGIAELGKQDTSRIREYWEQVVVATGARRVILVHWDDIFQPLEGSPLRPLPYFFDHVDVTMRHILELAGDSIEVLLPVPWQPTDPFAGLDGDAGDATSCRRAVDRVAEH